MRKKIARLIMIVSVLLMCHSSSLATYRIECTSVLKQGKQNTEALSEDMATFCLPLLLERIDDEAFVGTAVQNIKLSSAVEWVGERAFADSPYLREIYIPQETMYIAENALSGVNGITVYGIPGSYAADWATCHGYDFRGENIWIALISNDSVSKVGVLVAKNTKTGENRPESVLQSQITNSVEYSMRPQDRAELHSIECFFP